MKLLIYGCTDPEANNYNPEATQNDESCTYDNGGGSIIYITSSGGGGYVGPPTPAPEPAGEVLGETISCGPLISTYMRRGRNNDTNDVTSLQSFLNNQEGENLPVTGVYGELTEAAINRFQIKHWQEVLMPWVPFGLSTAQTPTGYVYETTQRWVNMVNCPSLGLPMPQLP
ncbi:MAG: peptidoglycan-binding domain-containing protein [Planctomycetota bacterium]|jgi:hypothetical protein